MLGVGGMDDAVQEGSGSRLRFMLGASSAPGHDGFAIGVSGAAQRPATASERSLDSDGAALESEAYHIQVRIVDERTAQACEIVRHLQCAHMPLERSASESAGKVGAVRRTGSHVSGDLTT